MAAFQLPGPTVGIEWNSLRPSGPATPQDIEKPRLVVANKMDEPEAEANLKSFKRRVRKVSVLPISAAFDQGIDKFRKQIRDAVEATEATAVK